MEGVSNECLHIDKTLASLIETLSFLIFVPQFLTTDADRETYSDACDNCDHGLGHVR